MNELGDQKLARLLLETRYLGYSFALYFRRSLRVYLALLFMFGTLIALSALLELWALFCGMLGLVAGVFLRDLAWVRAIGKTWPFTLKVTDWDKVEKLADEQPPASHA